MASNPTFISLRNVFGEGNSILHYMYGHPTAENRDGNIHPPKAPNGEEKSRTSDSVFFVDETDGYIKDSR